MSRRPHVLIVDDEANVRKVLGALLEQEGFSTSRAASAAEALARIRDEDPDVVLTDLKMPGMDGLELLARLRREFPEIPVVMLTAHGTVDNAVEAMKRGAHDFLTKPFDREGVVAVARKAAGQAEGRRREFQGPPEGKARCGMVGESPAMERLFRMIEKVAPKPSTVLVTGETGTGKELVADALHALSPRAAHPLVKINGGALPENLVESELFGHERGAFTGADRARPGRFELAHGGTLFLDEVGELPPAVQVKLLRVLQDGRVDRVGSTEAREVDVRLVAATHRDLAGEVEAGRFREDLLYRIQVVEIRVPPLRDRREDIPLLVDFFLDKHSRRLERPRPGVSPEALGALVAASWPGNVRQLENAIERALLLAEGPELGPADLLAEEPTGEPEAGIAPSAVAAAGGALKEAARAAAAEAERRMIRAALEEKEGNVTHAAKSLGLSRRGLQLKMKALGLRE